MVFLKRCTECWGKVELIDAPPMLETLHDVAYVPFQWNEAWGLFGHDGQAVAASVDLHGPDALPQHQLLSWQGGSPEQSVSGEYLYGGVVDLHYGHFLVNTLGRLWPLLDHRHASAKLVFHGLADVETWFAIPFITEIFAALGITKDRVVTFDRPTRIERILVPHTSFREQHFIHRIYADLGHAIGTALLSGWTPCQDPPPVYLSKSRLSSGVGHVVNEVELEPVLQAGGVEIVYPETLSLRDQAALFAERPAILGTTGSAFHSSIFALAGPKLVLVSPSPGPNSNFMLVDAANGNDATYYHPDGTECLNEAGGPFLTSYRLPQIRELGDELLQRLGEALSAEIPDRRHLFYLRTDTGSVLSLRKNDGRVVLGRPDDATLLPAVVWRSGRTKDVLFVLSPEADRPLQWPGMKEPVSVWSFRVTEIADGWLLLRNPIGGQFLGADAAMKRPNVTLGPRNPVLRLRPQALRFNARIGSVAMLDGWDERPGGLLGVQVHDGGLADDLMLTMAVLRLLPIARCLSLGMRAFVRSREAVILPLLRRVLGERSAVLKHLGDGAAWSLRLVGPLLKPCRPDDPAAGRR